MKNYTGERQCQIVLEKVLFRCFPYRGWRTVYATDNYIYIALNGTKDLETRIEKLSVFDWQGLPIKQYDLGVNIMDIIIDESLKTGYVIYRDDEYEYHLGNFDL